MNRELNDSLFELYEQGGLALYLEGTRGLEHALVFDTEEGELLSDLGEIARNRGVISWNEGDEVDE
jgi:hypothetical protein